MSEGDNSPNRGEILSWLLHDFDVRNATEHYAAEVLLSTADLWWLYEQHHLMAPAAAWLYAALHEDQMTSDLMIERMSDPYW